MFTSKYIHILFYFFLITQLIQCKTDEPKKYTIDFEVSEATAMERSKLQIQLNLEKALKKEDTIYIKVTNNFAEYDDYSSTYEIISNTIKIGGFDYPYIPLEFQTTFDAKHEDTETFELEIVRVPNGWKIGNTPKITCEIINYDIGDGLVGEYLFSTNSEDTSPNSNNNGNVFGPVLTTDRHGISDHAYYFDGIDDYIAIDDNSATDFETNQDFSISLWVSVKFPQATSTNAIFDILRKWSGDSQGYPYSISFLNENATQQNKFMIVRYDGSGCLNAPTLYSPVINSETWHHIVMVKEGTTIFQYLDNIKVAETIDNTSCTTTNNSHITIGSRGQLVTFFNGKIDDIRFYNRALSLTDIQSLFEE